MSVYSQQLQGKALAPTSASSDGSHIPGGKKESEHRKLQIITADD